VKSIRKTRTRYRNSCYLAEYGLPAEFPIEVETLPKIDTSIESEIANRRDMRYIDFTIDPKMLKILMMLYHLKIRKWKL
jgi:hypothetical protein